jgi:hypothetical protein
MFPTNVRIFIIHKLAIKLKEFIGGFIMLNFSLYNNLMSRTVSRRVISFIKRYQYMVMIGILAICVTIISIIMISTHVSAKKLTEREKTVVSIKIEKGDTLWSIASEHITDEYNDIHTYIKEIMKSNGLTSDTIHEGRYIIVPYYVASGR